MRIREAVITDENRALAENRAIRTITMWPALILAASRNESVIGRTENLDDSTSTKNGFSHAGAPPGSNLATNFMGCEVMEEKIILSQSVRPNENVNRRWLDKLNTYGANLTRLNIIRNINRVEMIAFHPINFCAWERVNWLKIVSSNISLVQVIWDGPIQIGVMIGSRIIRFNNQSLSGPIGRAAEFMVGSKDEKMSGNIGVCGWVLVTPRTNSFISEYCWERKYEEKYKVGDS